jgi:hypothetical protein
MSIVTSHLHTIASPKTINSPYLYLNHRTTMASFHTPQPRKAPPVRPSISEPYITRSSHLS